MGIHYSEVIQLLFKLDFKNMKKTHFLSIIASLSLVAFSACTELDVTNPNNPGTDGEVSDAVLEDIASGALYNIFSAYTPQPDLGTNFNANIHLAWTADHVSMTNNFRGMWSQFKVEPRVPFDNSLTFPDLSIITDPWDNWNACVSQANIVIRTVNENGGAQNEEQAGALGLAYFARGVAYGHLASTFDRAYLVPEDTDVTAVDPSTLLKPYSEVLAGALGSLDDAIEIFSNNTFSSSTKTFNGVIYDQDDLMALANTFAAHFLTTIPRNAAGNAATDWARVKAYAENGTSQDFTVLDDGQFFQHDFQYLSGLYWYFRLDHRILRRFNSTYPKRFGTEPADVIEESVLTGAGYNGDLRLTKYFGYSSDLSFFNLSRGAQLRSHYFDNRYALWDNNGIGEAIYMRAYMNDLILAEAEAMLGNTGAAIAILNDPTLPRKAEGELPDVPASATNDEVLELIFAERDIELGRTIFGVEHADMRRRDALQIGTILHFPVPASELVTLGETVYTFGGVANADGINTADGSNSWIND